MHGQGHAFLCKGRGDVPYDQRSEYHPVMLNSERLEALGPRGEACIILRAVVDRPDGTKQLSYKLATGERLKPTDDPNAFETLDGKRKFTLRRRPEIAD
jgi:hypothetical protein